MVRLGNNRDKAHNEHRSPSVVGAACRWAEAVEAEEVVTLQLNRSGSGAVWTNG